MFLNIFGGPDDQKTTINFLTSPLKSMFMYDALMNPSPCSGSVDLAVNKQNTLGKTYFKKGRPKWRHGLQDRTKKISTAMEQ